MPLCSQPETLTSPDSGSPWYDRAPLRRYLAPIPCVDAMGSPIELTTGQQFEIERFSRAIDATVDPEQLRRLAKQLLQAWHTQKAATQWMMRQQVAPPRPGKMPPGASPLAP